MASIPWRSMLQWRRFSSYRLERGLLIPADGATLETFEPWAQYQPISNLQRPRPPYLEFQALATAPKRSLTARILKFTGEWGLLGLLPHRIVDVEFPLLWQADAGTGYRALADDDSWELHQARLRRGTDGWYMDHGDSPAHVLHPSKRKLFYEPGTDEWRSTTRVVMRNMDNTSLDVVPFGAAWTRFFALPDASPSALEYDYPSPDSDEFWRIYCEPMADFYQAAIGFNSAIADIVHGNADTLNYLIQPATISTSANTHGILTNSVSTPSLLSVFALMAIDDFSEASDTGFCVACGTPFASAVPTEYCSMECQAANRKRTQSFRNMASMGSVPQIARPPAAGLNHG